MTREDQWRDHFHATVRQRDRWIQHCDDLAEKLAIERAENQRLREAIDDALADLTPGIVPYSMLSDALGDKQP